MDINFKNTLSFIDLKTYRGRLSYLPAKENNGVGSSSDRQKNCQHSLNEQGCGSGDQTGERMTDNGDFRAEVLDVRAKEQTSVRPNDGRFDHRNHSLLVPLDQPVPSDWVQCEDDFIFIYFIYQTHLGEEMYCAPHANLNDGLIHLMAIRKGVTRSQLITFLLSLKTGAFEKLSFVELHTIRAFRLEPISSGSHIVVDGELVEYGPIQGEVMPSMARLIVH